MNNKIISILLSTLFICLITGAVNAQAVPVKKDAPKSGENKIPVISTIPIKIAAQSTGVDSNPTVVPVIIPLQRSTIPLTLQASQTPSLTPSTPNLPATGTMPAKVEMKPMPVQYKSGGHPGNNDYDGPPRQNDTRR